MDDDEHGKLKAAAWRRLVSVDHVDAKASDEGLTIAPEWRAWRSQLRAVVRGERMDIPLEPERYANAEPVIDVQPSPPPMPADLAALALPDESLADLKIRLLTELTRLRSMAVGRLDMTDAERSMLTTLEGQVAQRWFTS